MSLSSLFVRTHTDTGETPDPRDTPTPSLVTPDPPGFRPQRWKGGSTLVLRWVKWSYDIQNGDDPGSGKIV